MKFSYGKTPRWINANKSNMTFIIDHKSCYSLAAWCFHTPYFAGRRTKMFLRKKKQEIYIIKKKYMKYLAVAYFENRQDVSRCGGVHFISICGSDVALFFFYPPFLLVPFILMVQSWQLPKKIGRDRKNRRNNNNKSLSWFSSIPEFGLDAGG